jgi:glycosyltransferase involved in cell wall biosynthesis
MTNSGLILPKVSIITVVFNNKANLSKTIDAVRKLNFRNIEYIIIDGGSTDGTKDVIEENKDFITICVSEKDNGIYDAMNKGLKLATGEYVWFMNAGDMPYCDDILNKIFTVSNDADVFYGDTEMIDQEGESFGRRTLKVPPKELTWKNMIDGMVVSHQALLARKSICSEYDLNLKFVADIDWTIKLLKKSSKIINTKLILCKFLIGGYSRKYTVASLKERYRVLCGHFNNLYVLLNHVKLSFKFIIYIIRRRKLL